MHFSSFLQGKANPQVMAIEPADMGKEGGGQRTKGRGRKKRFSILAWPDSRFTREEVKLQLSCWREMQSFINPGKPPRKEKKKAFLKTGVKGRFFPPHERASAPRPNQCYSHCSSIQICFLPLQRQKPPAFSTYSLHCPSPLGVSVLPPKHTIHPLAVPLTSKISHGNSYCPRWLSPEKTITACASCSPPGPSISFIKVLTHLCYWQACKKNSVQPYWE